MRTLVLIRHCHAEPMAADDHRRRLTARGRGEAELVRRWLEAEGVAPERVVVSTATRARETWDLAGVGPADPVPDGRVYEASVEGLRAVVAETPAQVATLCLVGHNPGIERLAWELDDSEPARDRTNAGMRPSAVAVFEMAGWDAGHGRLLTWHA